MIVKNIFKNNKKYRKLVYKKKIYGIMIIKYFKNKSNEFRYQ